MPKTYNSLTVGNAAAGSAILASDHAKAFENINNYRVPPMCIVAVSSFSLAHNTATSVSFSIEEVDTDGMFSATSSDITTVTAGVYAVTGAIYSQATIDTEFQAAIRVNSNDVWVQDHRASNQLRATVSGIINCAANDVIRLRTFQFNSATTARTCSARLSVAWLGQVS